MTRFEQVLNWMLRPTALAMGCMMVGLAYLGCDQTMADFIHRHGLNLRYVNLNYLTALGESKIYLIGFLLLALGARWGFNSRRWVEYFGFLWACVLIPNLICLGLKIILGRARPVLWFTAQVYGFHGFSLNSQYWSFPSGHATTIAGLVIGLCLVFPRYTRYYWLLGAAVMASRVLLLQHYLSDVLMAAWLACLDIGLMVRTLGYFGVHTPYAFKRLEGAR